MTEEDQKILAQQEKRIRSVHQELKEKREKVIEISSADIDKLKVVKWHENLTSEQTNVIRWVHEWIGKYFEPLYEKFEYSFLCELDIDILIAKWVRNVYSFRKFLVISASESPSSFKQISGEKENTTISIDHLRNIVYYLILYPIEFKALHLYLTEKGIERLNAAIEDIEMTDEQKELEQRLWADES